MKNIQAIFFDIDGTLVSFETHAVPPSTVEAIKLLRAKNIQLIIATGRALSDINNLGDLQFDGYITANGSYCITTSGEVLSETYIPKDELKNLDAYLKTKLFPCAFMTNEGIFINYVDESVKAMYEFVNLPIPEIKSMEEIMGYNVLQLDAFVDEKDEDYLLKNVLTQCDGHRWHPSFVDLNVKNTNKAKGIDAFREHYQIPLEHTLAFGDGGNDIPMLEHVYTGVAMGNANESLKEIADYVTSSVDDDGIMHALKHFGIL